MAKYGRHGRRVAPGNGRYAIRIGNAATATANDCHVHHPHNRQRHINGIFFTLNPDDEPLGGA